MGSSRLHLGVDSAVRLKLQTRRKGAAHGSFIKALAGLRVESVACHASGIWETRQKPVMFYLANRPGVRSSTDRASDYGSEGWGFESLRAHSLTHSANLSGSIVLRCLCTEHNSRSERAFAMLAPCASGRSGNARKRGRGFPRPHLMARAVRTLQRTG